MFLYLSISEILLFYYNKIVALMNSIGKKSTGVVVVEKLLGKRHLALFAQNNTIEVLFGRFLWAISSSRRRRWGFHTNDRNDERRKERDEREADEHDVNVLDGRQLSRRDPIETWRVAAWRHELLYECRWWAGYCCGCPCSRWWLGYVSVVCDHLWWRLMKWILGFLETKEILI